MAIFSVAFELANIAELACYGCACVRIFSIGSTFAGI